MASSPANPAVPGAPPASTPGPSLEQANERDDLAYDGLPAKSPSQLENGHGAPPNVGSDNGKDCTASKGVGSGDASSLRAGHGVHVSQDLLASEERNAVLARKMHLLNDVNDPVAVDKKMAFPFANSTTPGN